MSALSSVRVAMAPSTPPVSAEVVSSSLDAWSEDDECDRLLLANSERGSIEANGASATPARFGGKSNSTVGCAAVCGPASVRWLAVALSVCAVCLLLLASSRRLHRSSGDASSGNRAASLLYRERKVADWRLSQSAVHAAAAVSPSAIPASTSTVSFPPLSSLLSSTHSATPASSTSLPPLPGLSSFVGCVSDSSAPPRVAVVSTRSPHPTAAMLSVATLEPKWCVVVLSELDGSKWSEWTSNVSRAAALSTYNETVSSLTDIAVDSNSSSAVSLSVSPSSFSRVAYIDRVEQRNLPYTLSAFVSAGAADVRHLGYLLAMHAGAAAILDLHDHTVHLPQTAHTPYHALSYERQAAHFLSAQPFTHVAQLGADKDNNQDEQHYITAANQLSSSGAPSHGATVSLLNPYPLYGQVDSWPRGLPLSWAGATLPSSVLSVDGICLVNSTQAHASRRLCRPVVQHFLAGHYSDVDGVYGSVSSSSRRSPFDFLAPTGRHTALHINRKAPAMAVPRGTYMPFNARSTLFLPDVYAALTLLGKNKQHQPMADVVRAYVIQTALTYSSEQQPHEQCVIVTPPRFAHFDNSSSTTTASQHALSLARIERLLGWLALRQKGTTKQAMSTQLSELLQWLYDGLHEAGELDDADVALVRAWLSDVSRVTSTLAQQEQGMIARDGAAIASTSSETVPIVRLPNASSSNCFPSYSLPSVHLSSPSASLNLPAQPAAILASDGNTYSLANYADGFLFPDKYASGVFIDEKPLHSVDPSSVKPAGPWLPYPPHRHPPKPRVDFILRAFSGYSPLTSALLRSIDTFVPWKQMGDVIVVLDDSDADRHYATSLPDDVKVHFEPKPAFFLEWGTADMQTGALGVARQANGYALGLYSNWVSDRYSDADYICVLDPDMLFVGRGSLPLMFDWDEQRQLYKPVWICRDSPEPIFVESSYKLFGLDQQTAPGCMYQLPVCVHRSTLGRVRLKLNEDFNRANSSDYATYGLDAAFDRDSEYERYGRQYDARRSEAGSVLPAREGGVPPAAFDRTYMRMVNRDLGHAVCQFCVWGSYILTHSAERELYTLHLQGHKDDNSECPQLRAATHSGYLVPSPKMSPAYYQLADRVLLDGVCRSSLPTDCIVPICAGRSQWYDAMSIRSAGAALSHQEVLRQELLYRWELEGIFLDSEHEKRCRPYTMAAAQQLYEWVQLFDLSAKTKRDRHCTHIALTD